MHEPLSCRRNAAAHCGVTPRDAARFRKDRYLQDDFKARATRSRLRRRRRRCWWRPSIRPASDAFSTGQLFAQVCAVSTAGPSVQDAESPRPRILQRQLPLVFQSAGRSICRKTSEPSSPTFRHPRRCLHTVISTAL